MLCARLTATTSRPANAVRDVAFRFVTFRDARWQAAPCGGNGSGDQHSENFYFSGAPTAARDITFDSCRFTNGPASGKVVGRVANGSGPNSASLFLTGAFDHLIVRNCVFDGTGDLRLTEPTTLGSPSH